MSTSPVIVVFEGCMQVLRTTQRLRSMSRHSNRSRSRQTWIYIRINALSFPLFSIHALHSSMTFKSQISSMNPFKTMSHRDKSWSMSTGPCKVDSREANSRWRRPILENWDIRAKPIPKIRNMENALTLRNECANELTTTIPISQYNNLFVLIFSKYH